MPLPHTHTRTHTTNRPPTPVHTKQTAAGIEPGIHVSIKSSAELVHATLAYSAAAALLSAYADWRALHAAHGGGEGAAGAAARQALLASADGGTMQARRGPLPSTASAALEPRGALWPPVAPERVPGSHPDGHVACLHLCFPAHPLPPQVVVDNRLGVDAAMELDFGDRL